MADSSPEEKKVVNRETVRKIHEVFGVNVRYLEYEPETEKYGGDIYRKWGDAVQHVETEYSQFCTDKEFLLPISLSDHVQFLDENLSYSAITGDMYHVERKYDIIIRNMGSDNLQSIDHEDVVKRLKQWSSGTNVPANFASTWRSSDLKMVYQSVLPNLTELRFGEVMLTLIPALWFRTRYVKQANVCRDVIMLRKGGRIHVSESSSNRYQYIDEYPKEIYQDAYDKFVKYISEQLLLQSGLQACDSEELIVENVLGRVMKSGFYGQPEYYKWMKKHKIPIDFVWYYLPDGFKRYKKKIPPSQFEVASAKKRVLHINIPVRYRQVRRKEIFVGKKEIL